MLSIDSVVLSHALSSSILDNEDYWFATTFMNNIPRKIISSKINLFYRTIIIREFSLSISSLWSFFFLVLWEARQHLIYVHQSIYNHKERSVSFVLSSCKWTHLWLLKERRRVKKGLEKKYWISKRQTRGRNHSFLFLFISCFFDKNQSELNHFSG